MYIFKKNLILFVALTAGCMLACNLERIDDAGPFVCGQTITDARDGKSYKTIWIADDGSHDINKPGKCWMADNLDFNTSNFTSNCYENEATRCDTFGRMYNDFALTTICFNDWHIASPTEWSDLFEAYGWTKFVTGNGPIYSGDSSMFLPGGVSKMDFLMGGSCFMGPDDCTGSGMNIGFWATDKFHSTFFNRSGGASVFVLQFTEEDSRNYVRCVQDTL